MMSTAFIDLLEAQTLWASRKQHEKRQPEYIDKKSIIMILLLNTCGQLTEKI